MNKIGARRLLKLASHLRHGTLGHKKFDFGHWNVGTDDPSKCGTNGCALGECPIVFPRYWIFANPLEYEGYAYYSEPLLRHGDKLDAINDARDFFNISWEDACMLFVPDTGEGSLPGKATRIQVAAHIEKFVKENSK